MCLNYFQLRFHNLYIFTKYIHFICANVQNVRKYIDNVQKVRYNIDTVKNTKQTTAERQEVIIMTTTYSVEIEQTMYADDLFNGTFEECVEYINEKGYTREENDVRIAKILVDEDNTVAECLELITEF